MGRDNERGLLAVVYRDNALTDMGRGIIVTPHGLLPEVAERLYKSYPKNAIAIKENGNASYLISGVYIETARIATPKKEGPDEISLVGEVKTTIELLARHLGLLNIPEESFKAYE